MAPVPDFTGYATRSGLRCADGRIIMAGAFQGNHGQKVPLLWQHGHNDPDNVLGHAILMNVEDGVRADAYFNSNPKAQRAKQLVLHGDVTQLSIYANQLMQKGQNVHHGNIREVSLVISGANPGAIIDPVVVRHGDEEVELQDEAIIYSGLTIEHAADVQAAMPETKTVTPTVSKTVTPTADNPDPDHDGDNDLFDPKDGGMGADATIADVVNSMTEEQKNAMYYLVGAAMDQANNSGNTAHSGLDDAGTDDEGDLVSRNVFDQTGQGQAPAQTGYTLTHADVKSIVSAGVKCGSLKNAAEAFALEHGIDSIDVMFPEVKLLSNEPDFQSRRMEWVQGVLSSTRKSPFSRVKTLLADITPEEARAKGYVKGNMKNEEFFGVTRRTTTPTTVYKKQKLDRDDVLDITDFDVVAWMKSEMRLLLDEEVARAILIGDGRDISSVDKIKDPVGAADGAGIRSILNDHEIYTTTINVNIDDANSTADEIVDAVVRGMRFYRGTGRPTLYTTLPVLTNLLLAKDTLGRRLYATTADLAAAMMVRDIVTVEVMEEETDLLGIVVNLTDYNIGADSGGEISLFDFFDIDFNQQKYLIETRLSGALVKFKAALAVKKVASSDVLVDPLISPVQSGNTVSGANQTHVTYVATGAAGAVTISGGSFTLTTANTPVTVQAAAAAGYFFASNAEDSWTFEYQP